jgi:acid phosphatase (class A)
MTMQNRYRALLLLAGSVLGPQAMAADAAAATPQSIPPVDLVGLLGPPPAADSAAQQADLAAVLAAQREAHANGTTARAVADAALSCARVGDVLGQELNSPAARLPMQVIQSGALSAAGLISAPKMYWKRPRPFLVSKEVEALADMTPSPDMNRVYARNNTSYPSGHAAFGMACGLLLAQAIPEKRAELFARGRQYGQSRMIVGAHFPTDVAAGQVAATVSVAMKLQDPAFQRLFLEAVPALRTALGFPVQLPDLEPNKDQFKSPPAATAAPAR